MSRRSGDEFLYLMLEAKDVDNARAMADRILAMLATPCVVEGIELTIRASVGLAMYPADGSTPDGLIKRADLAMYEKKRSRVVSPPTEGAASQ